MTNTSHETAPHHRIRWLSVVGGFMDGTKIEFAPGLNCIIGARGTGKTTALEFIRFALDAMPDDREACKRIEGLVNRNLDFGRVDVGIETKDGLTYVVSRSVNEAPVVLSDDGEPTEITLKAGGFFAADIFSQNEVESIADRSLSQLDLIDTFDAENIADLGVQIKHVGVELAGNANAIQPLQAKIATLKEELDALPGIEEQLKKYSAATGGDSAAINAAHEQKSLRDREKRAMESMAATLTEYHSHIGQYVGYLEQEARAQFARDMLEGPNKDILMEVWRNLGQCARALDGHIKQVQALVQAERSNITASTAKLAAAHTTQEMAFRALIEKHQAAMGQATERSRLEKVRNGLLAKKRDRDDDVTRLTKLHADSTSLLRKLSELRDARFTLRKTVADRINEALSPTIRVSIVQDEDRSLYRQLVEEELRGAGLKQGAVAQKIVNALWPADLAAIVKSRNGDALVEKAELNPSQAEKVVAVLASSNRLHELETVELIDQPKIELNDGGTYKDSHSLSTGQKCTTILPIILMESEKPLLVDQPEDNLDNRFISQTVVDSLRKVKARRQLIFVTHNPNIPVLGDAEKVFVMESDGTAARVAKEGSVDACKAEIVTLLEGGEEAFKQRKERYRY